MIQLITRVICFTTPDYRSRVFLHLFVYALLCNFLSSALSTVSIVLVRLFLALSFLLLFSSGLYASMMLIYNRKGITRCLWDLKILFVATIGELFHPETEKSAGEKSPPSVERTYVEPDFADSTDRTTRRSG